MQRISGTNRVSANSHSIQSEILDLLVKSFDAAGTEFVLLVELAKSLTKSLQDSEFIHISHVISLLRICVALLPETLLPSLSKCDKVVLVVLPLVNKLLEFPSMNEKAKGMMGPSTGEIYPSKLLKWWEQLESPSSRMPSVTTPAGE